MIVEERETGCNLANHTQVANEMVYKRQYIRGSNETVCKRDNRTGGIPLVLPLLGKTTTEAFFRRMKTQQQLYDKSELAHLHAAHFL